MSPEQVYVYYKMPLSSFIGSQQRGYNETRAVTGLPSFVVRPAESV